MVRFSYTEENERLMLREMTLRFSLSYIVLLAVFLLFSSVVLVTGEMPLRVGFAAGFIVLAVLSARAVATTRKRLRAAFAQVKGELPLEIERTETGFATRNPNDGTNGFFADEATRRVYCGRYTVVLTLKTGVSLFLPKTPEIDALMKPYYGKKK